MINSTPRRGMPTALASLAVTAAVALTLGGCSAGGGETSGQTLRVQVQEGEVNVKVWTAIVDGFEAANPGVTVEVETISGEAKGGSNVTVVEGDNPPDVVLVPTNTPAYQSLIDGGALLDLKNVWSKGDLDNRYPAAVNDVTTYDGVHYVISTGVTYYGIVYYNKDLLAEAGIDEPADHQFASAEDLYDAADALRAVGVEPLALGAASGYPASWMVDDLLPTSASPEELANYLTSWKSSVEQTAKYTDPAFVDVLTQLDEYNKRGVYQAGFLSAKADAAEAQFQAGQAGMVVSGGWYPGTLDTNPVPFDVGWALLPPVNEGQKAYLSTYFDAGVAIASKSKNIELAEQFLVYVLEAQTQADTIVAIGQSSPSVNDVPASDLESLLPMAQEIAAYAAADGAQAGWTSLAPAGIGQALVDPLIQQMYAGQTTPEAIAQAVEDALPGVRAEN